MKDEMFNELLESVQQADAIMRSKARSFRVAFALGGGGNCTASQ